MTTETDPRPALFASMATVSELIAGVTPGHLDRATPDSSFTVRDLLGHITFVVDRASAAARGEDPMAVPELGPVADHDWPARFDAGVAVASQLWADGAHLTHSFVFPWVTQDGAECLRMWTNEMIVHGWDLAVATGQHGSFDDDVVAAGLSAIKRQLPIADRTLMWTGMAAAFGVDPADFAAPFANAVPVADDASLLDRIVAWNGRDPHWTRP